MVPLTLHKHLSTIYIKYRTSNYCLFFKYVQGVRMGRSTPNGT